MIFVVTECGTSMLKAYFIFYFILLFVRPSTVIVKPFRLWKLDIQAYIASSSMDPVSDD